MSGTAKIFLRIEPEIKEQAKQVLDRPGISMSDALGMSAAGRAYAADEVEIG
ncbi:MAG: type II toxin-antitoxin system RelB/DinJ family antitoxin [Ruminiclostridium sp.]